MPCLFSRDRDTVLTAFRGAVASGALMLFAAQAYAASQDLGFFCITNDDAGQCAIGEAQLGVTVSDEFTGQCADQPGLLPLYQHRPFSSFNHGRLFR